MLQFICLAFQSGVVEIEFQYISCCSLSTHKNKAYNLRLEFQYISCCSLSKEILKERGLLDEFQYISCCSLSQTCYDCPSVLCLFQYISCCSLSYFVIYFNHLFYCFNTSHVVVYQGENSRYYFGRMCFNTSHVVVYHRFAKLVHRRETFQYISCCSLSYQSISTMRALQSFNTSYVVVYR